MKNNQLRILLFLASIISLIVLNYGDVYAISQDDVDISNKYVPIAYTVYADSSMTEVIEEGTISNPMSKYSWSGIVLQNGQVAVFAPTSNANGFYCVSGTNVHISYTLSKTAYHNFKYCLSSNQSVRLNYYWTIGAYNTTYTAPSTGYYFGQIINLSSDAFSISNFTVTF